MWWIRKLLVVALAMGCVVVVRMEASSLARTTRANTRPKAASSLSSRGRGPQDEKGAKSPSGEHRA